MDFADRIRDLAQRVEKQKPNIQTEEACKNAFVMPFLNALGYDVFNPEVVVPEFTADVGVKKNEKVDYAIKLDGQIIMLVECKGCGSDLSEQHMSQLYRYFSVTESRFAVLTNGIQYWFYSDLDQSNRMDSKPFFVFDVTDYRAQQLDELRKFVRSNFDVASILETASYLKYSSAIRRELMKEFEEPSEEIMRLFVSRVYEGRFTQNVRTEFEPIVQQAFKDTIRELVNQRLSSALDETERFRDDGAVEGVSAGDEAEDDNGVVTTEDEIEGFHIVKAIVREVVDAERIVMRDAKSYCAVLLDDNNRRPLARLHFNRTKKYIGLFDGEKKDEKVPLESLNDIYSYADRLKATAQAYES